MRITQHLQRKLKEVLGSEAADDLLSVIRPMESFGVELNKLNTKIDAVAADLRNEMQLGFSRLEGQIASLSQRMDARFQQVDARFQQVDARFEVTDRKIDERIALSEARMDGRIEKALREQTRFFFLAWAVQLAAVIGIYAQLSKLSP